MSQNRPRKSVNRSVAKTYNYNIIDPLARWINQKLEIDERLSPSSLRKLIWVSGMVVVYIFFQHNFDGLIRDLNKTYRQVNEERAAYISQKSKYLFASKQSEVEHKLEEGGFEKNETPPIKIKEDLSE